MPANLQLTDGNLALRPPRSEDAPALTAAVRESLAELQPWLEWATQAYDEASALRWLEFVQLARERAAAFHFAITDAASGEYIGNCGLDGLNPKQRSCNLGYWVRTTRTGQGIASRAARLAARFAFESLGLLRVEIVIANANQASQRAAQKAGARYEGLRSAGLVVRTQVYDAAIYSFRLEDIQDGAPTS